MVAMVDSLNADTTAQPSEMMSLLAAEIASSATPEEVREALSRVCGVSAAESARLVNVPVGRLSTELYPAGTFPEGEVYDRARHDEWMMKGLISSFDKAAATVGRDVAGFLEVVFCSGDAATADLNAAVQVGAKRRVAQQLTAVHVGYFCRDGIEHLTTWGPQWAEHPFPAED